MVRMNILGGKWVEAPDITYEEIKDTALSVLGINGLVDIDGRGVLYRWSKVEGTGFTLPDGVIKDVASLFATAFQPYLASRYCTRLMSWGSYGVKHDLETTFEKARRMPSEMADYYISNGFAILGYVHYLLNVMNVHPSKVGSYFRPVYGCCDLPLEFNLFLRMPECYGRTIEFIHRGR